MNYSPAFLPEFCIQVNVHCDVVAVVATIVPSQLSNSTCPFEHCPAAMRELKFSFTIMRMQKLAKKSQITWKKN